MSTAPRDGRPVHLAVVGSTADQLVCLRARWLGAWLAEGENEDDGSETFQHVDDIAFMGWVDGELVFTGGYVFLDT